MDSNGKKPAGTEARGYVLADTPIQKRSQDRLNRARIAEAIADQVIAGPGVSGLVVGITGKWGAGKTSMLRMTEEAVREKDADTLILHFNPWLFSTAEELVSRFLQELSSQLSAEGKRRGVQALENLGKSLATYASALEPLGWIPVVGPWLARFGMLGRVISAIRSGRRGSESAEGPRDEIKKQLAALGHRVLVVIDDLDRVEAEQIRDMVRLVKLVADFPNTTYLLSYDREPVEGALGGKGQGREYLEKIVQVVHDLPEPPPEVLAGLLVEELEGITSTVSHGPLRPEDWQNIFPDGVRPFFRTIRDVRRYLNGAAVSLRVVGQEVALVDVLALEAIRIFAPDSYAQLPAVSSILTAPRPGGQGNPGQDKVDEERIKEVIEEAGDYAAPTEAILRRLFRRIDRYCGGMSIEEDPGRLRKELRVSNPEILQVYLQRTLPHGVVSAVLVSRAIDALTDRNRLRELFDGLDAKETEALIGRLEDYEGEYDLEAVEPALPVLINEVTGLREGRESYLDFGAEMVVDRVVLRLLRRIDAPADRLRIIRRVLPSVEQLSGRMLLLKTAGYREFKLISEEAAQSLYEELRESIRDAIPETLATERNLLGLFILLVNEDPDRGKAVIRGACRDDAVMLRLLRSALGEQLSQTIGEYAVKVQPTLPWRVFEEWFGGEALRSRISELAGRADGLSLDGRTLAALEAAQKYASGEIKDEPDPRSSVD